MKPGLIVRTVVLVVLVAFLASPQSFAFVFAPLTKNGQPAIYTQNSLLNLTLSHLLIVAIATLGASVLAVGLAILVTRPAGMEFLPLSRMISNVGQTFPPVAFSRSSPNSAASANVPSLAPSPASRAHSTAFSFPVSRDPIRTSCPSSTSLPANVCPTVPVPSTPIRMPPP